MATFTGPATAALTAGEFVVRCHYSHTNTDDPIVFPGQPGASHSHDFFGNTTTNANSTYATMTASTATTSCVVTDDTAGYWMPTPSIPPNGPFHANGANGDIRAYYNNGIAAAPETIPRDTQMVAGDAHASGPQWTSRVMFYCGADSTRFTPVRDHPYNCQPYKDGTDDKVYGIRKTPLCSGGCGFIDGIVAEVKFPQCYDGVTPPRPADFTYDTNGTCPSSFAHEIPFVSLRFHLGIMDPCPGTAAVQCGPNLTDPSKILLTFSSGPYYTMHADFWNTWKQTRLNQQIGKTPTGSLVLPACLQPKHYSISPPSCGFLPS